MKNTQLRNVFIYSALAFALTACSMEASIESIVDDIKLFQAPAKAHGLASGAAQMQLTTDTGSGVVGAYKYSHTVGLTGGSNGQSNALKYTTTAGGYKVYGTIQGAMVAK